MTATLIAILASVIPPDGVTHIWIFEGKLAIGTVAFVGSAWVVYRRRASGVAPRPVHQMS